MSEIDKKFKYIKDNFRLQHKSGEYYETDLLGELEDMYRLNSRNLLERFMKYLAMKDAIGMRTELYKQLIDEFIESEVGK